jgi:protein arginine kinase
MRSIEFPRIQERRRNDLDEFVFSSRVRLARNIEGITFPLLLSDTERSCIDEKLVPVIRALEPECVVERMDTVDKDLVMLYLANRVLTREFITNGRVFSHDPGGNWVAMFNEDDHLRLHAIDYGFNIKAIYARLSELLDRIEDEVSFAFDEELGYLTSSVLNVGTGLRLSALVNLHGIVATKKIENFVESANNMGYSVVNVLPESPDSGLFHVFNIYSLGTSEEEMISDFRIFLQKVRDMEFQSREEYFENHDDLEISLEEIFELSIRERIDWSTMLYYVSLIDALNRRTLEIEDIRSFRSLVVNGHEDTLFYRDHVESENIPHVRMNMLKRFLQNIRYKQPRLHV